MKRAFAVLELIIVIAILGILMTLLIPAISMVREATRQVKCLNNLRQLGLEIIDNASTSPFLPENRFNLSSQGVAQNESLWASRFLHGTSIDRIAHTPSYWICPSGLGVHEFPTTVSLFNHSDRLPLSDETADYVGNGGLISPRSILMPLPSYSERGGVIADVFQEHPKRRMTSVLGGMSHTICVWESLGGAAITVQPISNHRFITPWQSSSRGWLRSDSEPSRVVSMQNSETVSRYVHSINGRLCGYLALFDSIWQPLESYSTDAMSLKLLNTTNRHRGPLSFHNQTVPMVFLDGGTRAISTSIDGEVIINLATLSNDLPVEID